MIDILENHTDLITARDENCYDMVKEFKNARFAVCPALFASKEQKLRKGLKNIGIVLQSPKGGIHSIPETVYKTYYKEFEVLENKFQTTYIANYIDDYLFLRKRGQEVLYSSYSEDYIDIMNNYDLVVSTRVHGCGLASSLGIPNILIPHDGRYTTAIKFKSHIIKGELSLSELVKNISIEKESQQIIDYKAEQKEIFKEIIQKNMIDNL